MSEPWPTFQADLAKGRWDVPFFASRFLGVTLHPGQVRFAEAYLARRRDRPWAPAFINLNVSAGNRAGKTLVLAIVVFHACIYKMGLQIPTSEKEARRWLTLPYTAYHFGIESEIAALVFREIVSLMAGTHVAQGMRGCPLSEAIPDVVNTDTKWNGMWEWIKFSAAFGGAEIHFRTTKQGALGSLGRDMNFISYDECGFDTHLPYVVNEVLHFRRLGTGGPLALISTPTAGITDFADFWVKGDPEYPNRSPRAFSMRMSSEENIGFGLTREEFDIMTEGMDEDLYRQNVQGFFVQAKETFFNARTVDEMFVEEMQELTAAQNRHIYVQGVDPALNYDECWSLVLDVTDNEHWTGADCDRIKGRKTTDDILELMISQYNAYEVSRQGFRSENSLALDATGMGGAMVRERLEDAGVGDIRNIQFGGNTSKGKRKILADLRTIIDSGRLRLPRSGRWLELRKQLIRYRTDVSKPEDDGIMALGCAVQEGLRYGGANIDHQPVKFDMRPVTPPHRYAHPSNVGLLP